MWLRAADFNWLIRRNILESHHENKMQLPRRNAASALEDASTQLRASMEAARPSRCSLLGLRTLERQFLRSWAEANERLFSADPTLTLPRRQLHGEHAVAYDSMTACWWKVTHPGKAGVGAEFIYEDLPPFSIREIMARELLPSEYLERLLLHNDEFGDDIRLEGYLDLESPSILISQPDIKGTPATKEEMEQQMYRFGFLPLPDINLGNPGSISFYHPERRIALFDAHPGNFFHTSEGTLPIDGILTRIQEPAEHTWLMDRVFPIH